MKGNISPSRMGSPKSRPKTAHAFPDQQKAKQSETTIRIMHQNCQKEVELAIRQAN